MLKVRDFGTRKWPIVFFEKAAYQFLSTSIYQEALLKEQVLTFKYPK